MAEPQTAAVTIIGLGPAGLDSIPGANRDQLMQADRLILRTEQHPAAAELAGMREVELCDDLYEKAQTLEETYRLIVERVLAAAPVTYAVPGSPLVGETTVQLLREATEVDIVAAPSFLDVVLERTGIDPLAQGLVVLDAHRLPATLSFDRPTVIGQLDTPLVIGELKTALDGVLGADHELVVMTNLGSDDEHLETVLLADLAQVEAGPRVTVAIVEPVSAGWPGLVDVTRRLRAECPWDAKQTHHTLVRHLIEEAYETVEAIGLLSPEAPGGEVDPAAYVELEEELGDLLLQVLFHANLAGEAHAFDIDHVAERLRNKLVARHPHVFGELEVDSAAQVEANWERIKHAEKERESLMDDVPEALPALARAAKVQRRAASVGFDWPETAPVIDKLREEADELARAQDATARAHEIGDLLFTIVNLGRHLDVDPEMALRQAVDRFRGRFRWMEGQGDLSGMSLEKLDRLWDAAKGSSE